MHVSYSGPREDVSLKALGGYAPSALQTDILPRSRVGDIYMIIYPPELSLLTLMIDSGLPPWALLLGTNPWALSHGY